MRLSAKHIVGILLETTIIPVSSKMTKQFGQDFKDLPPDVKEICHQKYHRWRKNPSSLNFEAKHSGWYVVEITRRWHALCIIGSGDASRADVIWDRILDYKKYSAHLSSLRS